MQSNTDTGNVFELLFRIIPVLVIVVLVLLKTNIIANRINKTTNGRIRSQVVKHHVKFERMAAPTSRPNTTTSLQYMFKQYTTAITHGIQTENITAATTAQPNRPPCGIKCIRKFSTEAVVIIYPPYKYSMLKNIGLMRDTRKPT